MIEGTIRSTDYGYKNGLVSREISIPRNGAVGLPFEDDARVEIQLRIDEHTYTVGLRATPNMPNVWICPDALDADMRERSLAEIFRDHQLEVNQRVGLTLMSENHFELKRLPLSRSERTTDVGYTNRNGQRVERKTDLPGTDHNQLIYLLHCTHCLHKYGANGSDIHLRKCPHCQKGAAGLPTT